MCSLRYWQFTKLAFTCLEFTPHTIFPDKFPLFQFHLNKNEKTKTLVQQLKRKCALFRLTRRPLNYLRDCNKIELLVKLTLDNFVGGRHRMQAARRREIRGVSYPYVVLNMHLHESIPSSHTQYYCLASEAGANTQRLHAMDKSVLLTQLGCPTVVVRNVVRVSY